MRRLGFVGTPCQVQGLRKLQALQAATGREWIGRVELVLGLFCTGNWSYACMRGFLEKHGVSAAEVTRMEISGGVVKLRMKRMQMVLPLRELRRYTRMACRLCVDFTSELSDISAGSAGSPPGWSTLIVRTRTGEILLNEAVDEGAVELIELEDGVEELSRVAGSKVEKNTRRIEARIEHGMEVPHYSTRNLEDMQQVLRLASGKGYAELWREIVATGVCDACGACAAVCGQIQMINGLPRLKGRCPAGCELCYAACTRTALPLRLLEDTLFRDGQRAEYLGRFRRIVGARSTADSAGQDGGAVTALIKFSLNSGFIDGALLTCRGDGWEPAVRLVHRHEDVETCAGTVYAASSPLPELRRYAHVSI